MLFISFVVGISYSISVIIGVSKPWPSLGFSGVVMGMIGLSAYLMPKARIKVFWWYWIAVKIFYVPAWVLAVSYIGLDTWTMLSSPDYGGINVVAHVAGGLAGYLYGYFWLKDRRDETQNELNHEIKAMSIHRKYGKLRSETFRHKQKLDLQQTKLQNQKDHDKFMGRIYQMVKTHRDSEAIYNITERYNLLSTTYDLEQLFEYVEKWGASRTILCIGRLLIYKLDKEKRHGIAIVYIEKCQIISAQFILADISRTLFFAEMAFDMGKSDVVKSLLKNAEKRYGPLICHDQCNQILQKLI
jgi:hypothetical protein